MIRPTTKKEIRRVQSLRKISGLSNAPRGLYFVAADNKAYVCDTVGMMGAKEMVEFNAKIKCDIAAQVKMVL